MNYFPQKVNKKLTVFYFRPRARQWARARPTLEDITKIKIIIKKKLRKIVLLDVFSSRLSLNHCRIFRWMVQVTYHVTSQHNIILKHVILRPMSSLCVHLKWSRFSWFFTEMQWRVNPNVRCWKYKKMRKIVLLNTFSSRFSLNHLGFSEKNGSGEISREFTTQYYT